MEKLLKILGPTLRLSTKSSLLQGGRHHGRQEEEGNLLSLQVSSSNSVKTPITAATFTAGSNSLAPNSFLPAARARTLPQNLGKCNFFVK